MENGEKFLHPDIVHNIRQSEIEGGMALDKAKDGNYFVQTKNTIYQLKIEGGKTFLQGNGKYCPESVEVKIHGSTWGGSMLKLDFIGRGMFMEFHIPSQPEDGCITTSSIIEIGELQ
jgi:hypothetical protein